MTERGGAAQRSMRANISATAVGNAIYTLGQFGALVALAQLAGPRQVGEYSLALAITAPIFLFLGLRLRSVQATDAEGVNTAGEYFGLRWVTSVLAVLISLAVGVVTGLPDHVLVLLFVVALAKAFEGQIDVSYGVLQRREEMRRIAVAQSTRGILSLAGFIAVLAPTGSVAWAAAAQVVVTLGYALTASIRVRAVGVSARPEFPLRRLYRLAVLALPLGVATSLNSLTTNAPRYVLEGHAGAEALGVFAVLAYALTSTGLIANSVAEAASPRLANLYARGDTVGFRRTLRKLLMVGLALGIVGLVGALLLGRVFLDLVFGPEYARWWLALVLLMAAAAVQYSYLFLGTAIGALRLFRIQLPLTAAGLLVVGAASLLAIPAWGMYGAAFAVLAGQILRALLSWLVLMLRMRPMLASRASRGAEQLGSTTADSLPFGADTPAPARSK
ncbi:lipopolysaccharide biosynthesis protein [Geodermatophilus sp. SYSU D00815]